MIRLYALLAAVAIALSFWAGWSWRGDRANVAESGQRAKGAEAVVDQVNEARAIEHSQADNMAAIGAKHEEDRAEAQAVPASVVAGVRDGSLQLRDDLATCETSRLSEAVAGAVERDARAELRPEVAGAALQIVTDAQDHVIACQAVVREYEGQE